MINSRLVYILEKNKYLSPLQSGFRHNRSTIDNLIDLETQIRNTFVRRNHLVSIFFDIEKAYDRTWRYGILRNLYSYGFKGNLPIFIQNFLQHRNFNVRIGNILSDNFTQDQGVPQGSVLSVTLFLISINKILNQFHPPVKGSLFVDDLHISCEGADMRIIERQLQTAINNIVKWADNNGFSFSPSKTKCVHFCRKRGLHPDPEVCLRNETIPIVPEVKYLGILFDKKLSFLPHIQDLRKKCLRALNILKVLSNTSWGADRTSLLRIYRAAVRSKLDYGCVVYGSACATTLQKLNTIHHMALRVASGAFRTSPVESLYVDCHEASLEFRRQILSLHYYFRTSSCANHPFHKLIINPCLTRLYNSRTSCKSPFHLRIKKILTDFNLHKDTILVAEPPRPPWENVDFNYLNPFQHFNKRDTADIIFKQLFMSHRKDFKKYTPVYTDGSKSDETVACAYVVGDDVCSHKLHPSFSIFSAEIMAIYLALKNLVNYHGYRFIIYTDSLSALLSLSHNFQNHPLIPYLLNQLDRLADRGYSLLFCWVPSHVGIEGNERADRAARSATKFLSFPLPYPDIKNHAKILVREKWQNIWDQLPHNKLHSLKPIISNWPSSSSRKHDVIVTRLRIGHTRFTHCHLLLGEPVPICKHCSVPITVIHILIDCPHFRRHRAYHFCIHPSSLNFLLCNPPHFNLFNFLKHIGFYAYI